MLFYNFLLFLVGVFNIDPDTSHKDIILSNNNHTMTTASFENRVALADVGFSRGQHYWEVTVDRYEGIVMHRRIKCIENNMMTSLTNCMKRD